MIDFRYNKEENIVYVDRRNGVSLDEIIRYVENIDFSYQDLQNLYIIEDIRHSVSKFELDDYSIICNEIKKRASKYDEVRHAVIVDNPSNTVLSILFESFSEPIENYFYKTFSTIDLAKNWLMLD